MMACEVLNNIKRIEVRIPIASAGIIHYLHSGIIVFLLYYEVGGFLKFIFQKKFPFHQGKMKVVVVMTLKTTSSVTIQQEEDLRLWTAFFPTVYGFICAPVNTLCYFS